MLCSTVSQSANNRKPETGVKLVGGMFEVVLGLFFVTLQSTLGNFSILPDVNFVATISAAICCFPESIQLRLKSKMVQMVTTYIW